MKIAYLLQGFDLLNGCMWYRNFLPGTALNKLGHQVQVILVGNDIPVNEIVESDVIVFSRTYGVNIFPILDLIKKHKKPVVYETDDDLESLDETNPGQTMIGRTQGLIKMLGYECNAITTTTDYLAKKLEARYHKKVYAIPNALDPNMFKVLPRDDKLRIGWTGGCTHALNLLLILDVIKSLQEKYDFEFNIQGFTITSLESQEFIWKKTLELTGSKNEQYYYLVKSIEMCEGLKKLRNFKFTIFVPTEIHPGVLSNLRLDIGLCPLVDSEFNKCKSSIKFYEYASIGAVTLASDVIPYNLEVNYLTDNSVSSWTNKIEALIVDKELRSKLLKEQRDWVLENRSIDKVALQWEKAFKEVLS